MNRMKVYTRYSTAPFPPLTTFDKTGGDGYWTWRIRAVSIKQAYFLAHHGQWASAPGTAGILSRFRDYWHNSDKWLTNETAEQHGVIEVAPYLADPRYAAERLTVFADAGLYPARQESAGAHAV